ncbi:hypothetical protein FRB94_001209 [Tulasnella sp. JGI-2019a]|nr:hypothetical protein FRB93_010589 [Tulasnella sp. JGI-2019a]KAG9005797.1 hypothetical protein FRB94_001209 [Tulasnella sp. JGI-2019a]
MAAASEVVATAASTTNAIAPSRAIPSNWKESVSYWWSATEKENAISQERLLRRLPFFSSSPNAAQPDPSNETNVNDLDARVVGRISRFELDTPKRFLNQFAITPITPVEKSKAPPPTVVLHGYGAGLGFFFLNFQALGEWAAKRGGSVYALDWLGMGLSARVPFKIHAKRENTQQRVKEAEDFFLDALEEWRVRNGFETMNLVGHSLGGYLSAAYALRHPNRVSRLILVSPAGVPRDPNATDAAIQQAAAAATEASASNPEVNSNRKPEMTWTRKLLVHGWEAGWSPFQVVRSAGFLAPLLVARYSNWRLKALPDQDARDMNDYMYHITRAKGSGEYCISHILAPGAHARLPLVDRVDKLTVPTTFVYGDDDWMDSKGGAESVKKMRAAGNKDVRNVVIPYAGHHVYLDNPDAMNELLAKELDKTVPSSKY